MGAGWRSLDITAVMSRHRKAGRAVLRLRAVRRTVWSGRAARMTDGPDRSGSAAARLARLATAAVAGALAVTRSMRRRAETWEMIRGLLLTPWFAVGAGLVVAASLTLVAPRAVLVFPPEASGRCVDVGCPPAGQAGHAGHRPGWRSAARWPGARAGRQWQASGMKQPARTRGRAGHRACCGRRYTARSARRALRHGCQG
jgi:hypothetical protein